MGSIVIRDVHARGKVASFLESEGIPISEYHTVQLEMNDAECIKAALKELGYVYEEHKDAQNLIGWQGDIRKQKANIIVRRKYVGSVANDVGFLRKADGKYEMVISEYDKHATHSVNFMQKLLQLYGKHRFLKQAKQMGYVVKSQKVDEKGRIKIRVMGH